MLLIVLLLIAYLVAVAFCGLVVLLLMGKVLPKRKKNKIEFCMCMQGWTYYLPVEICYPWNTCICSFTNSNLINSSTANVKNMFGPHIKTNTSLIVYPVSLMWSKIEFSIISLLM